MFHTVNATCYNKVRDWKRNVFSLIKHAVSKTESAYGEKKCLPFLWSKYWLMDFCVRVESASDQLLSTTAGAFVYSSFLLPRSVQTQWCLRIMSAPMPFVWGNSTSTLQDHLLTVYWNDNLCLPHIRLHKKPLTSAEAFAL